MQIVLAILSVGLLGLIVYFAVSPKSSKMIKLAAVVALGFIGISIGVCVFFLIKGPSQDPAAISLPVFQDTPTVPAQKTNVSAILVFITFLLVVLGLIIIAVRRDRLKNKETPKENEAPASFQGNDDLNLGFEEEPEKKDFDDSFDIDI